MRGTEVKMAFNETDKKKAAAIVRIFETGRAAGNYSAVAVLDDGAGISYGIAQFTHRSGSLSQVVEDYLATGSPVGRAILAAQLPLLKKRTAAAVRQASANLQLRKALKTAAITAEMRRVQDAAAESLYLRPAAETAERMGFAEPLSLAVLYDSMTHGSWERIRDQVPFTVTPKGVDLTREHLWITTYLRKRDAWLASVGRLAPTRYRTQFFLSQVAISNWRLKLPLSVHGVRLTCADLICDAGSGIAGNRVSVPIVLTAGPPHDPADKPTENPPGSSAIEPISIEARPSSADGGKSCLESIEGAVDIAIEKYDRVESMIENVVMRADSAKSLWTMVAGTAWQTLWAIIGFFAGLPKEVWFVVAVIVGLLCAIYLYRQIVLGKIREMKKV